MAASNLRERLFLYLREKGAPPPWKGGAVLRGGEKRKGCPGLRLRPLPIRKASSSSGRVAERGAKGRRGGKNRETDVVDGTGGKGKKRNTRSRGEDQRKTNLSRAAEGGKRAWSRA